MNQPSIGHVEFHFSLTGLTVLGYVLGPAGTPILVADLTSFTLEVRSRAGTVTAGPTALTVVDVIFDTLVVGDPRWGGGAQGYNCRVVVPASAFPLADTDYRVSLRGVPSAAGEQPFGDAWDVPTRSLQAFWP